HGISYGPATSIPPLRSGLGADWNPRPRWDVFICHASEDKEEFLTSSPPQAARIPTASRFVFPRWLRWVPPTTALLGPRRGFTFGLPVYRSFGQRSSEGKERGALYPRPKNAEALRRTW